MVGGARVSETQTPSNEDFMREFVELKRKVQDISNSAVSGNQLATGDVVGYFGTTRTGCLLMDGSAILDADWPALTAYIRANLPALIIDGVSVNLPDGRGFVLGGAGGGGFVLGTPTGAASVTLTAAQSGVPAHAHPAGTTGAGSAHNHTINAEAAHTHGSGATAFVVTSGPGGVALAAGTGVASVTNTAAGSSHTHTSVNESAHTHSFTTPNSVAANAASPTPIVQPTLPLNWFMKT